MTVQLNVPTGAELRAHVERWEALPESERPEYPAMVWAWHYQRWEPEDLLHSFYRFPDDDTPQPGLRLVPLPETERVPWWEAVGRLDPEDGRIIAVEKVDGGAPRAFFDEEAWMLVKAADGTVEVLVEPQSATPATDSVPTSAVASSERASEVVGGGGGAGATTPTRPDPPEGWVVCRDREILGEADQRRMVRWWCGSWSDPLGGWVYDARYVDDDRYAVPVDMVAEPEPWVPQRGERVLMEAVIEDDGVGSHAGPDPLVHFIGSHNGTTATRIPVGSLRPFPEDGEA